ncbi:MAG: peroxiredoxin [bacterium]|nr:peroxiredoxin [bacterium]
MHRLSAALLAFVLATPALAASELPAIGTAFPSWSLRDHTGTVVTSESLRGKTYLLWYYPKAQTPGCTIEGRGLRDDFPSFQQRGVEILGVSFDDPRANATFVTAEQFPFRLLSDTDRTLALQVGAAASADAPVSRRVSFLVGPDGKVIKTYGMVIPTTHAADVLADLVAKP